jgi:hypothetical protein
LNLKCPSLDVVHGDSVAKLLNKIVERKKRVTDRINDPPGEEKK